jgi:hypothetical protein
LRQLRRVATNLGMAVTYLQSAAEARDETQKEDSLAEFALSVSEAAKRLGVGRAALSTLFNERASLSRRRIGCQRLSGQRPIKIDRDADPC